MTVAYPREFPEYELNPLGRLSPSKVLRFALDIARGMNYLHECKSGPIFHCDLKPKCQKCFAGSWGGHLKIVGLGLVRLSKVLPDKVKLAHPEAQSDRLRKCPTGLYVAPEIYKDETFDRSVDAFSFGRILYEMIDGVQPFHPASPEEAARLICLEGHRPTFRIKLKSNSPDLKELIEECWDPDPLVRPTFSEIILRLDKIAMNCVRQGWWKDTFKLPWK